MPFWFRFPSAARQSQPTTVLTIDLLTSLRSIVFLAVFQHTLRCNSDVLNMMMGERQEKTALHFSAGVSNFSVTAV